MLARMIQERKTALAEISHFVSTFLGRSSSSGESAFLVQPGNEYANWEARKVAREDAQNVFSIYLTAIYYLKMFLPIGEVTCYASCRERRVPFSSQ
jgi:hypothetical protein